MVLSNINVEQINSDNSVVYDKGEILSRSEIKKILLDSFDGTYYKDNYIYGEYNDRRFCLFFKNISYLGTPHPYFKKRIQISLDFKKLYESNKLQNIVTLIVGVYKYKDTLLFCDFDSKTYINNKSHNSSAHVYTIDLLNGKRNGLFTKKDVRGNIITVFDKFHVNDYLKNKFNSFETSGVEIFDTLDDFFASMVKCWHGIDCYMEMIENNFSNKFQPEWPGFYLEYKLSKYLEENHKTDIICYSQNKKKDDVDLDLFFPKLGYYGDLKAHSNVSSAIQGNDYDTIMELLEVQSIYYVVCNHDTVKDKDCNYEVTEFWNGQQNKEDKRSYGNKMKNSVQLKGYQVLELNKYNKKYLSIFKQGKNSDGKPRNPKIMISEKNIGNFLVHFVDFD